LGSSVFEWFDEVGGVRREGDPSKEGDY